MIELREIKTKELKGLIESDWYRNSPDLPITSHRAIAQTHNPRANPDDVCLILALDENEGLLGYIGILPDNFAGTGKHVGWLSCWWTHPEKGKKVGLNLFLQALIVWDHRLVITDFTPQIKNLISKTRMFSFTPTQFGIRGFIGFNLAEVLPRKRASLKKIKPLLELADNGLNHLNVLRCQILKRRFSSHQLEVDEENFIDDEIGRFINQHQNKEYFKRSATEFNWMLHHPWVLENDERAWKEAKKYYFSSAKLLFRYHCLNFRKNKKLVAFAILRQRNQAFTLPYIYAEKGSELEVLKGLYEFLLQHQAVELTVFHRLFVEVIKENDNPFFYMRELPKDFAVSNELSHIMDQHKILQDGDGDYAFT
ncbi:MAG: hypothetical protein K9H64_08950 [Bacteroidales bacterium]|nr:hypothetical protein [Bacteroidales bacterium]MCF8455993.1 hypothetical protein [Bacteroidales bacterium]